MGKPLKVKSYYCVVKGLRREDGCGSIVSASTASKARYQYFLDAQDWNPDVRIMDIDVKSEGNENAESQRFRDFAKRRAVPFVKIGMRVTVSGREGHIVGSNYSLNLDVEWSDTGHVANCHPHSDIAYYAKDGSLIERYDVQGVKSRPMATEAAHEA